MLYEFIDENRSIIISRTTERVRRRPWPSVAAGEIERGIPLFLTQLVETLRWETLAVPRGDDSIGEGAALHGADLLSLGFTVSQVVHDYGDICQIVTALAVEQEAEITNEEFQTLNRCLDTAIAEAVTAHARVTAEGRNADETQRLGSAAHELRDYLNTALLAFRALKRGAGAIDGSTGAVLGRSLMSLQELIDHTLAIVRLESGQQKSAPLSIAQFLDDIAASALLHSEYRKVHFKVESSVSEVSIDVDRQLLTSAVMNLLHNAFKNTPPGGHVVLRARTEHGRLLIDTADECGGIPPAKGDLFQPFGERRGRDRSGLGLGLSIARKAIRAHGGDITIQNMPGKGCVFTIDLPLAAATTEEHAL